MFARLVVTGGGAVPRPKSVSVFVRTISQQDVLESAKLAKEAELRRDFERHGLKVPVPADVKYSDKLGSKHRKLVPLRYGAVGKFSSIANNAFVAPCATLIGNVEVWDCASVWYGCVIKGDVKRIRIGGYTNVQDKTVIQEAIGQLDEDHDGSTIIGHYVTIGHKCFLRACTVESNVIIGMGTVIEEGAYIEEKSIVGAGSLVAAGTRVPTGELWVGRPAQYVRKLTDDEIHSIYVSAVKYHDTARMHNHAILDSGGSQTAHWTLEQQGHQIGALEWPAVDPEYGLEKSEI